MSVSRFRVVVCLFLTLFFAGVVAGQSLTLGSLVGRVTDPTGAVIPGAKVQVAGGTS